MILGGQRPSADLPGTSSGIPTRDIFSEAPPGLFPADGLTRVSVPIRQPSTLIAPVPYSSTLAATVCLAASGLRATTIGSCAGFSAVPHPSHSFASVVAGAVIVIGPRLVVAPPS